jgi:uncharacterized protein YneF (UPF0154 family)
MVNLSDGIKTHIALVFFIIGLIMGIFVARDQVKSSSKDYEPFIKTEQIRMLLIIISFMICFVAGIYLIENPPGFMRFMGFKGSSF